MKKNKFAAIAEISVGKKYINLRLRKASVREVGFEPTNPEKNVSIMKYLKDESEEK